MRVPQMSVRQVAGGVLVVALFLVAFWPTFVWMAERFDAPDSFYSHGWLIPIASGWLGWQRREVVKRLSRRASLYGLLLLVPSVFLHVLATWWHVGFVSGLAMLGTLGGLMWTCWGWPVLWALRFPVLFLVLMVPLPSVLLIAISFKLKLMAAALATAWLNVVGIPALQAGSMIRVPGASVIVDDTCSGLRSLISLIALAVLWTSVMGLAAKRWQKLTIVACSIPIALAANMARILAMVLLAAIYGPKAAEGFLHYGSGLVVFGVALAALLWVSRSLARASSTAPAT